MMKKILLSAITLMTFIAFYGQENEPKNERLTASFEKQWIAPLVTKKSNIQEVTEVGTNKYENPIASYTKVFFDISVKHEKARHVPLRPYYATAFILKHKSK